MTAYRSIDGTDNNQNFNATATDMTRVGTAHFADGISKPIETINPRTISDQVVGQGDPNVPNPDGLSAFMYSWGQFIDHDLDLVPSDGVNHIDILNPGGGFIPLTRSIVDPANHNAINAITGWLDASMVYGSDQATANGLRLADGHLKTSAGNNLPIDPVSGQPLAGDVRAAENPGLTALQTLFVREHNYQVDQLKLQHADWTGDHLYQEARAIVGAEISHITYDEFLPKLLGPNLLTPYHGFDPTVDPRITEEFAGAAYRFGHSIVSDDTERVDNFGVSSGEIELKHAFFMQASDFNSLGGADGFLRHLAADPAQAMDVRIVEGLRNFLKDDPDGQDLAAINIQRGHDLGLGTLNETREALGLAPYTSFDQLTDDPVTAAAMKGTFVDKNGLPDINLVDLWTGGLAEHHMPGAMIGETFGLIIAHQFEALRDGDQFYYEKALDPAELAMVKNTSLSDIIERDTDTDVMQADAFLTADRHASDVKAADPNAPQLIIGTPARDNIQGGRADDTLVVSGNVQNVTGGGGNDTFVFDFGRSTTTVVHDFHAGDLLEIHGVDPTTNFSAVHVSSNPSMTLVDIGQDHIKLLGVDHVSASDFLFHV